MTTSPATERRVLELGGLAVPFVEVTGAADGPTLTVIAGVHGCEYASMDGGGCARWRSVRCAAGCVRSRSST
jgi:hypothetical protein